MVLSFDSSTKVNLGKDGGLVVYENGYIVLTEGGEDYALNPGYKPITSEQLKHVEKIDRSAAITDEEFDRIAQDFYKPAENAVTSYQNLALDESGWSKEDIDLLKRAINNPR